MDKVKMTKSSPEYSVEGVSSKGEIGHATKVFPIKANAGQEDVSKVKMLKKSMNGYDPKAYA